MLVEARKKTASPRKCQNVLAWHWWLGTEASGKMPKGSDAEGQAEAGGSSAGRFNGHMRNAAFTRQSGRG